MILSNVLIYLPLVHQGEIELILIPKSPHSFVLESVREGKWVLTKARVHMESKQPPLLLLPMLSGAARTLGPDHSATKAFAQAAATMATANLWRARLAMKTLRRDQREAIAEAAEA